MSTQDFVAKNRHDRPRHEQNMPEGVEVPTPLPWVAGRPGDEAIAPVVPEGEYYGHPGPSIGFAMTLVNRQWDNIVLVDHEHRHDVEPLLAEIAMRRASFYGRAPIIDDVKLAIKILSYDAAPTQGEEKWRPHLVHDCGHNEHRRRAIVNSIPEEIIEGQQDDISSISGWWEKLENLF
jgi:hypothetical protein